MFLSSNGNSLSLKLEILDKIKHILSLNGLKYKENDRHLIIECPVCKFRDNKPNKLKLYLSKDEDKPFVFLCFRCQIKGNIFTLDKLFRKYLKNSILDTFNVDELLQLNSDFLYKHSKELLSSSFQTYPLSLVEYINSLNIENIIDFEQTLRFKQQIDLFFNQIKEIDNIHFLSDISNQINISSLDTIKNFYSHFVYLSKTRALNLLSFSLFTNLSLPLFNTKYNLVKDKVFLIDRRYKKDYRLRNSIGVLSLFNSRYFIRLTSTKISKKDNSLRYLYSKVRPKIFSNYENNKYEALLKSDLFFISTNSFLQSLLVDLHREFLLRDNEILFENNEDVKQFLTNYSEQIILQTNTNELNIKKLYVFEGYFDGLAYIELVLRLFGSDRLKVSPIKLRDELFNIIATGGVNNFRFVPLFLKQLLLYVSLFSFLKSNKIYNKLVIDKLYFVFDGDLDTHKIVEPLAQYLDFVLKKLRENNEIVVKDVVFLKFTLRNENGKFLKDVNELLVDLSQE
jgi:hypothetical protein